MSGVLLSLYCASVLCAVTHSYIVNEGVLVERGLQCRRISSLGW
jgi:hypothetical protein